MRSLSFAKLGNVPNLGLGTGSFGSQIGEASAFDLLDRFYAAGGRFVDTAHIYGAWAPEGLNGGCGNSEVAIGRWLKSRDCRNHVIIATKGGHPDFATGRSCLTQDNIRRHLEDSLRNLQVDVIDLYFLHRDDRRLPVSELLGWLGDAVDRGLIRAVACSNWRSSRFFEALSKETDLPAALRPVTNQISWNLAQPNQTFTIDSFGEQVAMDSVAAYERQRPQVPVMAYQSQAGGLFAHSNLDTLKQSKPQLLRRYDNPVTRARHRAAHEVAFRHGVSSHQVALAWLLHQPFPVMPLIGPRNPAQLDDSLRALETNLTAEDLAQLNPHDGARNPP